jgi:hypothetical protein
MAEKRIYAIYGYIGRDKDNRYSTGHLTLDDATTLCGVTIEGDWKDSGHSWNKDCKRCAAKKERLDKV